MSSPRKIASSTLDTRLKNTGPASSSIKTAITVQRKESFTRPITVQRKESWTKPASAQPTSRSRSATSSVTHRRSNSVNVVLGSEKTKQLNRTNSSLTQRSNNSHSCLREDGGKNNQTPTTKRGEKPNKENPQKRRTPSETKSSNRPVISLPVAASLSPTKGQTDMHERRNKVIEMQFISKKKKFITLKKELLRKQKCVLELYSSMAEMRAQLIKSSPRPAEDDNWKLENIRIFDLGQLQDLKLAGSIETSEECKEESKQNIQIVNTPMKSQCRTEGSGEEVPLIPQGSTSDIILKLENKLRKIPLDSLTLCHKMVSSRNSLLALVDALADDDGSGFTVEAELRRHLDDYQTEAEKFDKLLKEEQELQLQAVGDLISAIRGLSEENEKLRMLLSARGAPIMQCSQLNQCQEPEKSARECELETACADLDSRLKASNSEISELHRQMENYVDQLIAEREKNTSLSRQMTGLNDHQIAANHLIKELEDKLNQKESKIQKLQKVVDEQAKYKDMTIAAKASAELISQLEKQRDSLQQQLQQLMEVKERTEKEATVLIFDLDAKLQTSTKRGEREIIKNEKLQEELNILKKVLAETEAKVLKPHQTTDASVQTDQAVKENEDEKTEEDSLIREIEQEQKINELWFELQSTEVLLQAAQEKTEQLESEKAEIEKTKMELQEKLKAVEAEKAALEKTETEKSKMLSDQELEMERKQLMLVTEKAEEIVRLTKELKEAQKVAELNQQQFAKYEEKVSELYARLTSAKSSEGNSMLLQQKVCELQNQVQEIQINLADVEKRNYQLEQMVVQKQLEMEVHDRASRKQQKTLKTKQEQVAGLQATLRENAENMEKMKCELASKAEKMQSLYATLEFKEEQLQRLEKMVRQLEEQRMTKACLRMSEYKSQARNKCPSNLLPLSEFCKLKRGTSRCSKGMHLGSDHSQSATSSSSSSSSSAQISKKRGMPLDDGDQHRQSTDFRTVKEGRNDESRSSDDFNKDLYRNPQEAIPRKSTLPLNIKNKMLLNDNWCKQQQQQKRKKTALDLYQRNQQRIESYKAQKRAENIMKHHAAKGFYSDTRDRGSGISKENMHRNDGLPDVVLRKHMNRPNFKTNFRSCRSGKFYKYLKFSNRYRLPKRTMQIYPTIYEESEHSEDDRSNSEVMENEGQSNAEQGECKEKLAIYLDMSTDPKLKTRDSGDNENLNSSYDYVCDEVEEEIKDDDDDDDDDDELEDDLSIATNAYQTQPQHLAHSAGTDSETTVKLEDYHIYNVLQESDESYRRCIERISPAVTRLTDHDKNVRDLTPFLTEPISKTQNSSLINSINRIGTNSDLKVRKQSFKEVSRDREFDLPPNGKKEARVASTENEQGTLLTSGGNKRDCINSASKGLMSIYDTKDWQSSFAPKAIKCIHKRKSDDRKLSAGEGDAINSYSNYDLPSELFNKNIFLDMEELPSSVDDHKHSIHIQHVMKNKSVLPQLVCDLQDSFRSPNNYLKCSGDDRHELNRSETIDKVCCSGRSSFSSCEKKLEVLFKRETPITTNCKLSPLEMEQILNGSKSVSLKLKDSYLAIQPYNQMNNRQQEANIAKVGVKEQLPKKNMKDARFPPKIVLRKDTNELFTHYRKLNGSGENLTGRGNDAYIPNICMEEVFKIDDIGPAISLGTLNLEQVVNRRNIFRFYPVHHSVLAQGDWCKPGIVQRRGDNNENIFEHFQNIKKYPHKLLHNEIIYPVGEGQRKVKERHVTYPGYIQPVNTGEIIKSSVAYLPEQCFIRSQMVSPRAVQRRRLSVSNNKPRQQYLSDTSSGYIHPVNTDAILKSVLDYPSKRYLKSLQVLPQEVLQRKRSPKHLNSDVRSITENEQRKQCLSDTSSGFIQPIDADNLIKSVLAYLPNKCSGRSQFTQQSIQRKRSSKHLSSGVRSVDNNKQRKQCLADFNGIKKAESLSNITSERGKGPINKLQRESNAVLKSPVASSVTGRKSSVFQMTETSNPEVKKVPLVISSLNLHLSDDETETKNKLQNSDTTTSESPSLSKRKSNGVLGNEKFNYTENDLVALNNMLRSEMDKILTKKRSQILSLIPLLKGMRGRKSEKVRKLGEQMQLIINNASQSLVSLMLRGYENAPSNITETTLQMANILPRFVIGTTFCNNDESLGRNTSVYDSLGDDSQYSSSDSIDNPESRNSTELSKGEHTSNKAISINNENIGHNSEKNFESQRSGENSDENSGKISILQCPVLLKSNGIHACQVVADSPVYYDCLWIPESETQLSKTSFHSNKQTVSENLNYKDEQFPINGALGNQGTENIYPFPVNETIPEIRPYHLITNLEDVSESGYTATTYENIINANIVIEPEPAYCSGRNVSPSRYALFNMHGKSNSVSYNRYSSRRTERSQPCDLNCDYNSFSPENYDLINDPYHPPFVRNEVYFGDHEYSYPYYPKVRKHVIITEYTDSESDDYDDDDSEYSDSGTETSSDSCESDSMRYWPHEPYYNYYEVERV